MLFQNLRTNAGRVLSTTVALAATAIFIHGWTVLSKEPESPSATAELLVGCFGMVLGSLGYTCCKPRQNPLVGPAGNIPPQIPLATRPNTPASVIESVLEDDPGAEIEDERQALMIL